MTGTTAHTAPGDAADLERIFHAWDDALGAKDVDAAVALYAEDATLESPLVRRLLGGPHGVVPRGRVWRERPPGRAQWWLSSKLSLRRQHGSCATSM